MSRGQFLRNAAVGASVVGASMMGMSGVAHAALQPSDFAGWNVGILRHNTADAAEAAGQTQLCLDMAGVYHSSIYMMTQNNTSAGFTGAQYLVAQGCNAILGVCTSSQGKGVANYLVSIGSSMPYVECYATADSINKAFDPTGYEFFYRTVAPASVWAKANAPLVAPENVTLPMYVYTAPADVYGIDFLAGWKTIFPSPQTGELNINAPAQMPPVGDCVVVFGNPTFTNISHVLDSLRSRTDVKQIIVAGSQRNALLLGGYTIVGNLKYDPRIIGAQPWYVEESPAYQKWYSVSGLTVAPKWDKTPRAWDAAFLMTAGLYRTPPGANLEVDSIINMASSPPGSTIYPNEFYKLPKLNAAADTMNYEGASGPCDMLNGECKSVPFLVFPEDYIIWSQ